jgi:hypothetical protein
MAAGPVECLGMTFASDEERRAYFRERLREKLRDPAFRAIEGFPAGSDEDILSLSDPPYYTACPNPFLDDFVRQGGASSEATSYQCQPFASDVSEGKNDPVYNAHSYHTKVPHRAIMRYLLHYTRPGDLVFDGFAGTGMTGVAARLCGDQATVEALGYRVAADGAVLDREGQTVSRLGARRAILADLSPAATFISHHYNTSRSIDLFQQQALAVHEQSEIRCGWMYRTLHRPTPEQIAHAGEMLRCHGWDFEKAADGMPWARILCCVWSDIFACPECQGSIVFWNAAVDQEAGRVRERFACPHCQTPLTRRALQRRLCPCLDPSSHLPIQQTRQVPVLIIYSIAGVRHQKIPDTFDLALLEAIDREPITAWFPAERMPEGDEARRNDDSGITHTHHFYTRRNLATLANLWQQSSGNSSSWLVTGILHRASRQHQIAISRVGGPKAGEGGATAGHRRGTLYVPANQVEFSPCELFRERLKITQKAVHAIPPGPRTTIIGTSTMSHTRLPENSIDYVFTDPPFGGNILYSELNFVWEAWLKVFTNRAPEAVVNGAQGKDLRAYQAIMERCFREYHRVLKPGRWITVAFHHTGNGVWHALQEALRQAGFVIGDVRMLDKQIQTHTQRTAGGCVCKDLVINARKPLRPIPGGDLAQAGAGMDVLDFVRSRLRWLPLPLPGQLSGERTKQVLFNRMVADHIQRSCAVPISAGDFYALLERHLIERDRMYFLPEQAGEYSGQI